MPWLLPRGSSRGFCAQKIHFVHLARNCLLSPTVRIESCQASSSPVPSNPKLAPHGHCDSSRELEQSKATQAKPYLTTDDDGKDGCTFKVAFLCVSLISIAVLEYVKVPQLQGPVRSPKPSTWVPTRDLSESPVKLEICAKLSRSFYGGPEA